MLTKYMRHYLVVVVVLLSTILASAHDFEADGVYYEIISFEEKTVAVVYRGDDYKSYADEYSGTVTIPKSVMYSDNVFDVISIGERAFSGCSGVTSVVISEYVTSIKSSAFSGCGNLGRVELHDDIATIEYAAFSGCSSLVSIRIPNKVTRLENQIFYGCSSLVSVTIPKNVVSIGYYAFNGCVNLKELIIEDGNSPLFLEYNEYDNAGVGKGLFDDCPLETLYLGRNLNYDTNRSYGYSPFYGNINLSSIVIGNSVASIKDYAFSGCKGLVAITIPKGVVEIGNYVFDGCSKLKEIIIEDSRTPLSLGYNQYAYNNYGEGLFYDCPLESVYLGRDLTYYGSYMYGYSPFFNKIKLTEISIGKNVTIIDRSMFRDCSNLIYVSIPENVIEIGDYVFYGCSRLSSLTIPVSVTKISNYAFYNCDNLISVEIPKNVEEVGLYAFDGCVNLMSITSKALTPPTITSSTTFDNVDKSIPVYVPAGSVNTYKAADYWKEFTNIQPLPNEYILTVSSAGYASLFLDYAAAIPEGVEAYIATSVEGTSLIMNRVEGVLPANTGVIVIAKEGTYTFVESEDTPADVEGNLLSGTATDTYITAQKGYAYYVLARKNGLVAMYHPTLTDGQFLNNANRAYLALDQSDFGIFDEEVDTGDDGIQLSNGLRFDFSGTTNIAPSTLNSHPSTLIYDLQGRRVENPTKGIYIINGKKVVWK